MPEGHTIHRHARLQRRHLKGRRVAAWSPQARFDDGAARLDGGTVVDISAVGKHLFYEWGDASGVRNGDILHVHLGLFGKFRTFADDPPVPTEGTRLALRVLEGDGVGGTTVYLAGATVVDIIGPDDVEAITARLGPDPLDRRADPHRFVAALRRRSIPIGEALLDQKAISGIGNVYRAEMLFRAGIDPSIPANQMTEGQATALWDDAVELLRIGEKSGRIVTVDPVDVGKVRRRGLTRDQQRYAYKRHGRPCHRCGTDIVKWEPRARTIWACPTCQSLAPPRP